MPQHSITVLRLSRRPARGAEVHHNSGKCGCNGETTLPTATDPFGVALIRLDVPGPHTFTVNYNEYDSYGTYIKTVQAMGRTVLAATSGTYMVEIVLPI